MAIAEQKESAVESTIEREHVASGASGASGKRRAVPHTGIAAIMIHDYNEAVLTERLTLNTSDEAILQALIADIARHNEWALGKLYDACAGRVFALALRIVGDHHAAEEVVSDVFMQVWQQGSRFDPTRGKVFTWLLTMCRSRALDLLRRKDPCLLHDDPASLLSDTHDPDADPARLVALMQSGSQMQYALRQLTPTQQHLLSLAFFQGFSHQEIADTTGTPLGTVKATLRRSMITLKSMLNDQWRDGEDVA